jgi:hypothetical protein
VHHFWKTRASRELAQPVLDLFSNSAIAKNYHLTTQTHAQSLNILLQISLLLHLYHYHFGRPQTFLTAPNRPFKHSSIHPSQPLVAAHRRLI